MTRHTLALLRRNSRRPSLSKENLAPAARRSGLELLEERALLSATPMGSILAQYSAAETTACAALVSNAALLDQAPTVDLSAALDASGATLSGSAICFTVQSLSSAPGDSYDAALKTQRTWLDEWSNFYVDLWAYAGGAIVESVEASFTCDASCFKLVDVEAAGGYSIEYSTSAGTTSVVATGIGAVDPFEETLVARMKFAPVADAGIPTAEDGVLAPVDAGFSADPASQKLNGAVVESVSTPNSDLYPFLFDVDENGVVNTNDLGYFLTYVGQDVEDLAYPKYRVLDYDHNGTINTNDLAYFLQYLGVSAADGLETAYRAEPYVGDPTILDAPSGILTSAGKDYITVSWDSVPNAAQYSVAYKLASETTWTTCDAGPDLRYAITGLQADSEYNVRVVARGSGGRYVDSDWSDSVVVATKDASFFSSTEYEGLRQRYDDFSLPESFADVNIVVPTDWTAQALVDAIEVARSTPVDDVILLDPEKYSNASLDLSNDVITLDVDYESSGAISIVSRGTDRAQIVANYYDVTFDATAGLTQFGGFDFVDVNPYVSTYQATVAPAMGTVPTAVVTKSVGAYTWTGTSVADAERGFARGIAPTVSATPSANDYALLFVGGGNAYSNMDEFYATLRDYYFELVEEFSLDPTKIYILYADGDVAGTSLNLYYGGELVTSDMSFATNTGATVRAATGATLTSTLGEIANLMTADSHLFFYTEDHGYGVSPVDEEGIVHPNATTDRYDYLIGWDSEGITGATVRDALFQIRQGYVTCVFTQCYSGGILDDIFDPTTGTISTSYTGSAHFAGGAAANHYETSKFREERGGYVGYPQTFEKALRQCRNSTGVDAFIYTEQNEPFSAILKKRETYAPNQGVFYGYYVGVEHPWHAGESFPIFSEHKQSAPTITSHSETQTSISLTWSAVQGATSYTLEYAVGGSDDVKTVENISSNSYTVKGLNPETNYVFKVMANDSPYSASVCVWTKPGVLETPSTVVTTYLDVDDPCDGKISLREAIEYAEPGATITFANSLKGKTIALELGQLTTNKTLTIDASNLWDEATSEPGLTISGQGETRILYLEEGADVEINGVTLTNAKASDCGGAICSWRATLSLNNCVVCNSKALSGGGVYSYRGVATLTNCTITNNSADSDGGGANSIGGEITLINCTVANNTADTGGGVASYGEATLVNCSITHNSAKYGGGVYFCGDVLIATNCLVAGNSASHGGGVYYLGDAGNAPFYNCTIVDNTAKYGGGFCLDYNAVLNAYDSIVACNSASSRGDDVYLSTLYGSGAVANAYNTLSSFSNWTDGADNLIYNAEKPLFTNAASGDYTLAKNSQAIDKGNNQYVTTNVDLAENTRISGGAVDLGAYESWAETPSTVVTTEMDLVDYYDGKISLREALEYAQAGDTITFANSLKGKTIALDTERGQFHINRSITIDASNLWDVENQTPGLTISGQDETRILYIAGSLGANNVEINGITFTNGVDYSGESNGGGGAIYNNGATLSLENCAFRYNESSRQGGAVHSHNGKITFVNCILSNNASAEGFGGAISALYSTLYLENCAIYDNDAHRGGGISSNRCDTTLVNCTITSNSASLFGGGIEIDVGDYAHFEAYNSIIADNSATNSNADVFWFTDGFDLGVHAFNTLSSFTDWTSGLDNLVYDESQPLFANAAAGDYTLAANSQAINKGNNQCVSTSVDLAGKTRIVGGTVDLGAYEYQSASSALFDEGAELFDEMEDSLDLIAASLLEKR